MSYKSYRNNNCDIKKTAWCKGKHMTVAKIPGDIRIVKNKQDKILDLDKTINKIDLALVVLTDAYNLFIMDHHK